MAGTLNIPSRDVERAEDEALEKVIASYNYELTRVPGRSGLMPSEIEQRRAELVTALDAGIVRARDRLDLLERWRDKVSG